MDVGSAFAEYFERESQGEETTTAARPRFLQRFRNLLYFLLSSSLFFLDLPPLISLLSRVISFCFTFPPFQPFLFLFIFSQVFLPPSVFLQYRSAFCFSSAFNLFLSPLMLSLISSPRAPIFVHGLHHSFSVSLAPSLSTQVGDSQAYMPAASSTPLFICRVALPLSRLASLSFLLFFFNLSPCNPSIPPV